VRFARAGRIHPLGLEEKFRMVRGADPTPEYITRRAQAGEARAIRRLVRSARLNPLGLDWRRFTIAIDGEGEVIACGQVKPHRGGWRELASIVVRPEWQGRGIGSAMISALLAEEEPPLWLFCRRELTGLYERFGFEVVSSRTPAPKLLRVVAWLGEVLQRQSSRLNIPQVMHWRERLPRPDS
jgi:N-acetylglutamate synthase-like GNAT family acetyltransferase